ncbi:SIS domain-containing protein [Oxyplasma meridianum]|uniref:SIS domain-containing protein n=1 Tax=Oxyplasma meridianum TaxID=3073602 RepID=A0AAX4NGY6_9ARCH
MTDDLPLQRSGHPYIMYDMLRDSYNGVMKTLQIMNRVDMSIFRSPITVTGNGTALHSGIAGSQILGRNGFQWKSIQAYELEHFGRSEGTVIGISHTGKTKSTVDAMKKAGENAVTVGISHFDNTPLLKASRHGIVIGNSPDMSLCNTKAFFDNAFAMLSISNHFGHLGINLNDLGEKFRNVLEKSDDPMKKMAQSIGRVERIFVLGSGPNFVAAREGAQKIKESTHVHAEGIELEEFNHGCTSVIDDRSLVIIVNSETDNPRTEDIVKACRFTVTKTAVVNGDGDYSFTVPEKVDSYVQPILNMVPVYYLAYYMALEYGVNPDYLRFEDKRYLDYDNVVFPPGAH